MEQSLEERGDVCVSQNSTTQEKAFKSLHIKQTLSLANFSLGLMLFQIAVEGLVPESRHSHSACSWEGGVLIAGGLGAAEQPLGSVFLLRELEYGFQWQTIETHPPLVPR